MNKNTTRKYETDNKGHRIPDQTSVDTMIQLLVIFVISFSLGATHYWKHPLPLKVAIYLFDTALAYWYMFRHKWG